MGRLHPFSAAIVVVTTLVVMGSSAHPASAEPRCVVLDAETYCKTWSKSAPTMAMTEYVRSGETVESWKRLVTIIRYPNAPSLHDDVVPRYFAMVAKNITPGFTPKFWTPPEKRHAHEVYTQLLLGDPHVDFEADIVYFRNDGGKTSYAMLLATRVPNDGSVRPPSLAQKADYVRALQAIKT